jgi:hypothetical protein
MYGNFSARNTVYAPCIRMYVCMVLANPTYRRRTLLMLVKPIAPHNKCRVGQNYTCICTYGVYIRCVHTVCIRYF